MKDLWNLVKKWEKDDEDLYNKIMFLQEHNFKIEEHFHRMLREEKRKMIFELQSKLRE